MEYTLAQVDLFSNVIDKQIKDESRLTLTLLRVAQASKDGYERACRQLFGVDG